MLFRLLLLFTIVPALEIWILIEVGGAIGGLTTVAIILLTGFVGAWLARLQGLRIVWRIQSALGQGRMPGGELIDGGMLLVGAALLLTPGFLTDGVGFCLIFPPTRDVLKRMLRAWLERKVRRGDFRVVVEPPRDFPE